MNPSVETVALAIRYEATRELLELLTKDASDREAGRRAMLIAFIVDPKLFGTQTELAKRMGVSRARASQMLNKVRRGFAKQYAE